MPLALYIEHLDQLLPLEPGQRLRLGRHPDCEVLLESPFVGRHHAEVHVAGDAVLVRDGGSANGTFVNDEELPRGGSRRLAVDDRVRLGDVLLRLVLVFPVSPAWLAHEEGLVLRLVALANAGDLSVLPVLADVLEEAGCHDPDVLAHLRTVPHPRRDCCVLEALLPLLPPPRGH